MHLSEVLSDGSEDSIDRDIASEERRDLDLTVELGSDDGGGDEDEIDIDIGTNENRSTGSDLSDNPECKTNLLLTKIELTSPVDLLN
jgi:hypothetical protein